MSSLIFWELDEESTEEINSTDLAKSKKEQNYIACGQPDFTDIAQPLNRQETRFDCVRLGSMFA